MNEPNEETQETSIESFVIEQNEQDNIAISEADNDEVTGASGIIELPATKELKETAPLSASQDLTMTIAYRCLLGAVRPRNEDSCLILSSGSGGHFTLLPFGLYIVADGMGGHANGHMASKTASRVAGRHIVDNIYLPLLHEEGGLNKNPIQDVMVDAVQKANTAVYAINPETDGGTTLTVALVLSRRLHIAHVGDSRLYLLIDGILEQVTSDHSLVQRLEDVGQPADDVTFDQIKHVLLRAVGQVEEVEVDTYMRLLPRQGKLLLCSDGLSGFVPDTQIQKIMAQDISVEQIADELSEAAMDTGGYDNITAVVIDFSF